MIFKIFPSAATFHGVDYSEAKRKKGDADLVCFEGFREIQIGRTEVSKKEFVNAFEQWSSRNSAVQKPQFHAVLSCKGKELDCDALKNAAILIMKELGYSENPILIYAHRDTDNNHVHVVTSRVGVDGKKIAHDFENKRANDILNRLINLDPKRAFKQDLDEINRYRVSTTAQFRLMFELRGYNSRVVGDTLQLCKHGSVVGAVDVADLAARIEKERVNPDHNRIQQIRALLHKYSKQFDSSVRQENPVVFTSKSPVFQSALADYMKREFNIEFSFFSAPGKDRPYGYVVIDHQQAVVYKGSEIMGLEKLIDLSRDSGVQMPDRSLVNSGPDDLLAIDHEPMYRNRDDDQAAEGAGITSALGDQYPLTMDVLAEATAALFELVKGSRYAAEDTGGKSPSRKRKGRNRFL